MSALSIFIPRFKSINFYQNKPKIKLFLQTNALSARAQPPDPLNSPHPMGISGYAR